MKTPTTKMNKYRKFFEDPYNFKILQEILIDKKYKLRECEFAARNYDRYVQSIQANGLYTHFLSTLGKKQFDAFRRNGKTPFKTSHGTVYTNEAQLRFLIFFINHKIYAYMKNNYSKITQDMFKNIENETKRKSKFASRRSNKRQKLCVLSTSESNLVLSHSK